MASSEGVEQRHDATVELRELRHGQLFIDLGQLLRGRDHVVVGARELGHRIGGVGALLLGLLPARAVPVVGPVVVKPDMDENAKKGVEERRTVAAIFDRRGKPGAYAAMLYGDGDDCRGFYPRKTFVFFVCDKTMPPGTLRFLNEMEPETCLYVTEMASREWCDIEGKNWQDVD